MEKRAILAAVLMAGLLILYQALFMPSGQETKAPSEPPKTTASPPAQAPSPAAPPAPAPASAPVPPVSPPQRTAKVEAPLYRAVVSSEGGKLQEWTLKYRGEKPLVAVGEFGSTGLSVGIDQRPPETVPMDIAPDAIVLDARGQAGDILLKGQDEGLIITQTLGFRADDFAMDVRIRIDNPAGPARTVTVALPWVAHPVQKSGAEKFLGQHANEVVWSSEGHVSRVEGAKAVGNQLLDGAWVAVDSTWYLAAFIPKTGGFKLAISGDPKPEGKNQEAAKVTVGLQTTAAIAPGQSWEGRALVYIGPKEVGRLEAYGLEGSLNFGGFPVPRQWGGLPMEWLGLPILKFMNWVYRFVGNYGVAIILITILSKVLFYPLTLKSMRSMKAMQVLQPQINALRSKYKSDPQRLQRETLELYRKYKVNPMGGCLPMIAQVPIFYALYLALSVSVELQNAPFLCFGRLFGIDLWVCDLASHDPTYVLTVLMGVSMFFQQKMTPMTGDPRQAKMMLIMPFIFTFMFLNLPSGLVLYWFVSNVLQILQQKLMDRSASAAAREAKDAARA
ncbi:MAG: membrane protein insertase YidC [Actinobacteria bacterium]|nr:MAG: membrane protein insertase YidC [Actinomycetota bacterium]